MNSTVTHARQGVFFTSDLHLFHDKVAQLRGFPDHVSHNAFIADVWRKDVHPKAQVWVLGDVTGGGHVREAMDFLNELPGKKHLILGNHDRAHPLNRGSHRRVDEYRLAFRSVQPYARRKINGVDVMLSHFPYTGDSGPEDRHVQWRLPNLGRPLLHGHTHQPVASLNNDGVIHVGWDTWYRPVHLDDISGLLG